VIAYTRSSGWSSAVIIRRSVRATLPYFAAFCERVSGRLRSDDPMLAACKMQADESLALITRLSLIARLGCGCYAPTVEAVGTSRGFDSRRTPLLQL
jgi:hypothetical protein